MWFELIENRIPTVNPSTSVSVGSSPTAPKFHRGNLLKNKPQNLTHQNPQLRNFYALGQTKPAPNSPFCWSPHFIVSPLNLWHFFYQIISKVRKNCVNLLSTLTQLTKNNWKTDIKLWDYISHALLFFLTFGKF